MKSNQSEDWLAIQASLSKDGFVHLPTFGQRHDSVSAGSR